MNEANHQIQIIEMSEKAKKLVEAAGEEMGIKYFRREEFESVMRPSYRLRRANTVLPEIDIKGNPILFINQPVDILYGQNHVYTFTAADYERVILYVHGGAYVHNAADAHVKLCDRLAAELNAKVYMPMYTLAPQGTWKEGFALLHAIWTDIQRENKPVIIMGDSAGGGLALAFTEELAQSGSSMPAKMILFSPWVDVTMSDPEISAYEEKDVSLAVYGLVECGKMWAGETDMRDRRISPLYYTDWNKLPETLLFIGNAEIFYPDNMKLYHNLVDAGVHTSLVIGNGLFHVFPVYVGLPECRESRRIIKKFVDEDDISS